MGVCGRLRGSCVVRACGTEEGPDRLPHIVSRMYCSHSRALQGEERRALLCCMHVDKAVIFARETKEKFSPKRK